VDYVDGLVARGELNVDTAGARELSVTGMSTGDVVNSWETGEVGSWETGEVGSWETGWEVKVLWSESRCI